MWDGDGVGRRTMNPTSSPATSTPLSPHHNNTNAAPKPPPKVLIVGDVGTGKSTLVRYIQRLTTPAGGDGVGGGKQQGRGDPKEALSSTIGFNCECVCLSGGNPNDSSVSLPGGRTLKPVIFVEIGGNRSFRPECRAPAYCLGDIAAVLFVYKDDQPESIIPLKYWCDELQQYDLIQWTSPTNDNNTLSPPTYSSSDKVYPKLMVVKIQHTPEEGGVYSSSPRGFLMGAGAYNNATTTTTNTSVLSSSLQLFRQARNSLKERMPPQVLEAMATTGGLLRAALSIYRRVLLIIMSVALFGPNQKVVPFSAPTADSTLNHIVGGKGASQTQVCTANLEAFGDSCGELMEFFAYL